MRDGIEGGGAGGLKGGLRGGRGGLRGVRGGLRGGMGGLRGGCLLCVLTVASMYAPVYIP